MCFYFKRLVETFFYYKKVLIIIKVYYQNPPDQNLTAFKIHPIIFLIYYFILYFLHFYNLLFTITVTTNSYRRSVSDSQI